MIDHQVDSYIESQGKDPEILTPAEREDYAKAMIHEQYPGRVPFCSVSDGHVQNTVYI